MALHSHEHSDQGKNTSSNNSASRRKEGLFIRMESDDGGEYGFCPNANTSDTGGCFIYNDSDRKIFEWDDSGAVETLKKACNTEELGGHLSLDEFEWERNRFMEIVMEDIVVNYGAEPLHTYRRQLGKLPVNEEAIWSGACLPHLPYSYRHVKPSGWDEQYDTQAPIANSPSGMSESKDFLRETLGNPRVVVDHDAQESRKLRAQLEKLPINDNTVWRGACQPHLPFSYRHLKPSGWDAESATQALVADIPSGISGSEGLLAETSIFPLVGGRVPTANIEISDLNENSVSRDSNMLAADFMV